MRVTRYPEVTAYVTGTAADAEAIARAARRDVADGRAVNVLFESKGGVALVSRIMRSGHEYNVGHSERPATKHAEVGHAVAAALSGLERHERDACYPRHARSTRGPDRP